MDGTKATVAAAICSIGAIACYLLCYHMTTEHVKVEQKTEKFNLRELLKGLAANKALIGIVVCSVLMLLTQLTMQSMTQYVFPNYFGDIKAQSASGVVGMIAVFALVPFIVSLQVKFGRKELAIAGSLFGTVIFTITWFTQIHNAWLPSVYKGTCSLQFDLLGNDYRCY